MAKATVRLQLSSEKRLDYIFNALLPETEKPVTKRSQVMLARDSDSIMLKFEATDTVALRAALNAYLRWIQSVIKVIKTLKRSSLHNGY